MGWQTDRLKFFGLATVDAPPAEPVPVISTAPVDRACLIRGCPLAAVDIAYCAEHRRMADDGTLWLRCVFDDGHAPVAPNDPIACAKHRAQMEVTPMGLTQGLERLRQAQRDTDLANRQAAEAYVPDSEYDDGDDYSLAGELAGCCSPSSPCPDHIDDVIEDWQEARLERYLDGGR